MSSVAEITARLVEEGVPLEEAAQLAAQYALRPRATQAPESRVDGAPAADIGTDASLTPQGYTDDLGRATQQARDEGMTFQQPGTAAFETEGDLLQYRPGMSEEDYAAAKANRASELRMIRGSSPDPGGYTAFHPQQSGYLGTAEQQAEWATFLEENPEAQERYDPAAYEARMAEQRAMEAAQHARMLAEKYGQPAAAAYLESQRSGKPMDMDMVRTSEERRRNRERRNTEMAAREGGIDSPARAELMMQDERSGYLGAMGGAEASQRFASGTGPDGKVEVMSKRFERRTRDRKEDLDARKLALRNQRMLAGDNPRNNLANAYTLMGDPFQDGLTENQRRALQYMLPGGQLAAEVESRQLQSAQDIATSALRGTLGPLVASVSGGGQSGAPTPAGRNDVANGSNGTWRSPEGQAYVGELAKGFTSREAFTDYLVNTYNYPQPEAEAVAEYVENQTWFGQW